MRLRSKLLIIPSLVVLFTTLLALFSVDIAAKRNLQQGAESEMLSLSALLADQGSNHIDEELHRLEDWARLPLVVESVLDANNPEKIDAFVNYFGKYLDCNLNGGFFLIDLDGECIAAGDRRFIHSSHAKDVVSKGADVIAAYSGETTIGKTQLSVITSRCVVPLTAPVWHNGKVIAVLRTKFDMLKLSEYLSCSISFNGATKIFIHPCCVDIPLKGGGVEGCLGQAISDTTLLELNNLSPGINYLKNVEGDYILASTLMSNPSWLITVVRPTSEVLALVKHIRQVALLVFIILGILLFFTITRLVAPAVKGIEDCRKLAENLRDGKLDQHLHIAGNDEVAALACSLKLMAVSLEDGRLDLADSEQKYRHLFENAVEGIFQTKRDGSIITANDAAARLIDLESGEECIGLSVVDLYADLDDRDRLLSILRRDGRADNFEYDMVSVTGRIRKCELTARVYFDPEGDIDIIQGIILDVTERRQFAEALEYARETERLLAEARLTALRHQLNPHFLFNALNSLDSLMGSNPDSARKMVEKLASFCRSSLAESGDGMSSIAQEIEVLKSYLWIERMRWQDSLQVEWEVDQSLDCLQVPVFTLQPLVENAVKYGQRSGSDPLIIKIKIEKLEKCVLIQVANNGRWFDRCETESDSSGVGLKNLRERYLFIYGENAKVETEEREGFVFVSIICDFAAPTRFPTFTGGEEFESITNKPKSF